MLVRLNNQPSAEQTGILSTELARQWYKIYSGTESTLKVSSRMDDPSLYESCVGDRFGEVVESTREHKNSSHWQTLNTFSTIVTLYIFVVFALRCFPQHLWESNSYATANLFHLQLSPAWGKGLSTKFGWQFDLTLVFQLLRVIHNATIIIIM